MKQNTCLQVSYANPDGKPIGLVLEEKPVTIGRSLGADIITPDERTLQLEVTRRQKAEAALETARNKLSEIREESKKQRKRLQDLSQSLLHAQEEERKRISRELHDEIVQALVAIQYEFKLLTQDTKNKAPKFKDRITRTQDILEGAIDLVHGFAFDLRPSALDNLGLGPTLETFANRFQVTSGITVSLDMDKDLLERIGSPESTMFYRVFQEAFSNVSTHSQATHVSLGIVKRNKGIRMEITDDGIGIDTKKYESTPRGNRLGLIGMKERVEMLGGTFSVMSKPGNTTIRVDLPSVAGQNRAIRVSP